MGNLHHGNWSTLKVTAPSPSPSPLLHIHQDTTEHNAVSTELSTQCCQTAKQKEQGKRNATHNIFLCKTNRAKENIFLAIIYVQHYRCFPLRYAFVWILSTPQVWPHRSMATPSCSHPHAAASHCLQRPSSVPSSPTDLAIRAPALGFVCILRGLGAGPPPATPSGPTHACLNGPVPAFRAHAGLCPGSIIRRRTAWCVCTLRPRGE